MAKPINNRMTRMSTIGMMRLPFGNDNNVELIVELVVELVVELPVGFVFEYD